MPSIKRDANEGKGEVMITNNYFIEYRLIENNQLKDQVITLAKNIILMINDINKATIFKDIKQPSFIKQKLNVIHIEELIKQFPTLPLRVALIEYINTHGITLVIGACKLLANGRRLEDGLPTADDYDTTAFLYTYDANTKSVLPIIKIATRPTTETIKQQLIMDTPSDLDENIYKDTIMNESIKFPYTIGIQIFFSNLMLVNLNKLHLCEVVASPHSSDLQKYFIDNHIEVM
jgi:asparagine synthetase A